eukprot:4042789-Heterocapsa_arctica.AAC.1
MLPGPCGSTGCSSGSGGRSGCKEPGCKDDASLLSLAALNLMRLVRKMLSSLLFSCQSASTSLAPSPLASL